MKKGRPRSEDRTLRARRSDKGASVHAARPKLNEVVSEDEQPHVTENKATTMPNYRPQLPMW